MAGETPLSGSLSSQGARFAGVLAISGAVGDSEARRHRYMIFAMGGRYEIELEVEVRE
jgi:hypothetical protein